jgi:putative copper resistance protein D
VVLALLGIAFRAADGYGRPVTSLTGPDVLVWTTNLAAGRGALLTVACAAAVLGCAVAGCAIRAWFPGGSCWSSRCWECSPRA